MSLTLPATRPTLVTFMGESTLKYRGELQLSSPALVDLGLADWSQPGTSGSKCTWFSHFVTGIPDMCLPEANLSQLTPIS